MKMEVCVRSVVRTEDGYKDETDRVERYTPCTGRFLFSL